jgi:trehalose 6-phosphate synthase/phosphatase
MPVLAEPGQLIVASNRLPVVMHAREDGALEAEPASGGLVAALAPVLERQSGAWIGWPGLTDVRASVLSAGLRGVSLAYEVLPVELTAAERDAFYHGFSNEIVWPLFHDVHTSCNYDPAYWEVYQRVNENFARAIAGRVRANDVIWVHDYHLMLVGAQLRQLGVENHVGFFLHIPFPGRDIFRKLPWREPIADALLAYDLVGFQTTNDRRNFLRSVRSLRSLEVVERGRLTSYRPLGSTRETRFGDFPIGIDFEREERDARSDEASAACDRLGRDLGGRTILLGVDRLDYTKGIPERLLAFREALHRHPALRGTTTLVQLVVPSREEIPSYSALREEIERLVGQINGELGEPGWTPVTYLHHPIDRHELRGWYRAAHVALVTPLKDGMNLVAKEYCASRFDEHGVLVLSEFAGAAAQLGEGALLVNPHDRLGTADTIARACQLRPPEQRARMQRMRAVTKEEDVFFWAGRFLGELARVGHDAGALEAG